jgi:hypothetical protein
MTETWQPILTMLDAFGELLALAKRGKKADPKAVSKTAEGFRDGLSAALEVELRSVRLWHLRRGGFVDRVIPRPHATRSASYSDEARDLAEEQLSKMVDATGEYYLGYVDDLEPDLVAENWRAIAEMLVHLKIVEDKISQLGALVRDEHESAPYAAPVLPTIYRPVGKTDPGHRRRETRARRAGYQITRSSDESNGDATASTDQVFFVPDEPEERSVTKVAGLPYRAAGVPWPLTHDGKPMTFLAQFCFADSKDLVGKLPGDVLLIFAAGETSYLPPDPYDNSLVFEWYPLGLRDLIPPPAIPLTEWMLQPHFGILRRTGDDSLVGNPQGETKIGGEPAWIQADEDPGGRFLCELGRLQSVPAEWDRWGRKSSGDSIGKSLKMADAGCLYFFLMPDGAVRWSFQCF